MSLAGATAKHTLDFIVEVKASQAACHVSLAEEWFCNYLT